MSDKRPFLFRWIEAVRKCRGIPASAKAIMLSLAGCADINGGSCFPSLHRLADEAGLKIRQTQYLLRRAQKQGLIAVHSRFKGRRQTSNMYELRLPEKSDGHRVVENLEEGCTGVQEGGALECRDRGALECRARPAQKEKTHKTNSAKQSNKLSLRRSKRHPSQQAKATTKLWKTFFPTKPLRARVLETASYEEASTAMAWTLHKYSQAIQAQLPFRNVQGYFVKLLRVCKQGEKHLKAFSREDMFGLLELNLSPDEYLQHMSTT